MKKTFKRLGMNVLERFGADLLVHAGVPEEKALYLANLIVETEAFKQATHGLVQFQVIYNLIKARRVNPRAEAKVISKTPAGVLLDGREAIGALTVRTAREMAMRMAAENGIGFAAGNTHWIGALGTHLIPVAEHNFLAMLFAQSNTCKDAAPFGGIDARFSTNPIALTFPADPGPMIADFSTTTMSMAMAAHMAKAGRKTETRRFIDKKGLPANDPAVMKRGGTMMFAGGDTEGFKFYAWSLFIEALAALSGGSANNPAAPSFQSFSLIILNPALFGGLEYYRNEMERFLGHLKSARVRPGFKAIRLPGERGFDALAACRAKGIPLDDEKMDLLRNLSRESGIALEI